MSSSSKNKNMYGFDPAGLERAAKAAKELDQSPNAKKAYDLALKQEETKQMQMKINIKELEKAKIAYEAQAAKEKLEYEDILARERIDYKLQKENDSKLKELKNQEESIKRQEEIRRETIQYEHKLNIERERERLIQKYDLEAHMERKNMDIVEKKIRIKEEEKRKTANELASIGLELLGKGVKDFILDRYMFGKVVFGITFGYVIAYGFKGMFNLSFRLLERQLIIPKLTKDTSRIGYSDIYKFPYIKIRNFYYSYYKKKNIDNIFNGISFNQNLEQDLKMITNSILSKKKHNTPYRNLLFYGPPGNGKTLFAKKLSDNCGLDYAIMTGADVLPLGSSAITELNKLFDWAETSSKGMILFIDESDAFLKRRDGDKHLSENLRSVINCFLYRTGTPSKKFFVILATNTPELLDKAVQNRIDEIVYFDKPSTEERRAIINNYYKEYIENGNYGSVSSLFSINKSNRVKIESNQDDFKWLSINTEGYSSRELNKLIVLIHDIGYSQISPIINRKIIEEGLNKFNIQRRVKDEWENEYRRKNI